MLQGNEFQLNFNIRKEEAESPRELGRNVSIKSTELPSAELQVKIKRVRNALEEIRC